MTSGVQKEHWDDLPGISAVDWAVLVINDSDDRLKAAMRNKPFQLSALSTVC